MRTVFNNGELCHVWASRSQTHGKGSNLFFERDSIYSYGYHFEIARHITHNGQSAVLYNVNSYSPSTSKHQNYVRHSINHLKTFYVPLIRSANCNNIIDDAEVFIATYQKRMTESLNKAKTARTYKTSHLVDAQEMVNEGNEFAEFCGLKTRLSLPANFDELLAASRQKDQTREAEKAEQTRKRDAEHLAKALEQLEKWRKGELYQIQYGHLLESDCLRINQDRQIVETSRGATVPIEHAERAFRIMAKLHERREAYQRNGHTHHVGHYEIDRMSEDGQLKIGCHTFNWNEVEQLAIAAGWSI